MKTFHSFSKSPCSQGVAESELEMPRSGGIRLCSGVPRVSRVGRQ
jgi:hypothetical protein